METSQDAQLHFYQEIGQLFYAVAAADKVVRKAEYKALRDLVHNEWTAMDAYEDAFGTDAAYQIEIVFDWFQYEEMEADTCFDSFSNYYKENRKLFTSNRKQLIWKTVNAIAGAFSGKNKSEIIILTKLLLLLQDEH